jgi:hypothetical protein
MLDDCARLIRDLELNAHENIRRIGEALVLIFDIQAHIYEQRPDLTPEHLKKGWNRPRSATEGGGRGTGETEGRCCGLQALPGMG